jgi:hypothetical protein
MVATAWKFQPPRFNRKAWFSDYGYMKERIADQYANLDWAAERGSPDPVKLDRVLTAALQKARSDDEARMILRGFVRAFGDGHMSLRRADAPPLERTPSPDVLLSAFTPAKVACESLGFDRSGEQEFPFRIEGRSPMRIRRGGNSFASGVLDFEGRRFGFIRVGSFREKAFRGACEREWSLFRQGLKGTCESACRFRFELRVADRLLREIEARIHELERSGSRILVVDVTGNHGGHAWYRSAAQLFTTTVLPPLRASYVRNERTTEALEEARQQIAHYIATRSPPPDLRTSLDQAICRIEDLVSESKRPCFAFVTWAVSLRQSGCTRLTTRTLFSTGVLDSYDGPPLPIGVQSELYWDAVYHPVGPVWHGSLALLVDEETASGAELFAGLLSRQAGATLVGRHTASTGGGWSLGRQAWVLPESKMQLYLPDTVNYWPDGANAREGLDPDVPTRWRPDEDPALMGKQLLKALRSVDFPATTTSVGR